MSGSNGDARTRASTRGRRLLPLRAKGEIDALLRALGRAPLPGGLVRDDSTIHLVDPLELRPDLLLLAKGDRGPWRAVEVQLDEDPDKLLFWPLLTAVLRKVRGEMGDVLVVTARQHVAAWARAAVADGGPLGSQLGFTPAVVHLGEVEAKALLAAERPELAFFAAWAMQERHGSAARMIVEAALARANAAADEALRRALFRSILFVISDELAEALKVALMNIESIPESSNEKLLRDAFEQRFGASIEARGEARGEAKMLLTVLAARGFVVDEATRARVLACTDAALLEGWGRRAVGARTLDEVFADGGAG
jgi:hypothetical protein